MLFSGWSGGFLCADNRLSILKVRVLGSGGGDKKGLSEEKNHPAGPQVHVYEPSDDIKPCFGQLALIYR